MQPFENSTAWKACHSLALEVYHVTARFPREERFGITSQIRRAAVSVPANLVEGSSRRGSKELRRFLDIARGSLAEVAYFLILGRDLGLLDPVSFEKLMELHRVAGRLTWGLYSWADKGGRR